MERQVYCKEYNTIEPNGYNIREGGGKSEKVSDILKTVNDRKTERDKSKKRWITWYNYGEKSKVDGRTTSWSVRGFRDGKGYTIG
jgi:hypothetical protein